MISGDKVLSTPSGGGFQVGSGGGNATNGMSIADTGQLTLNFSPTGAAAAASTQNAPCGSSTISTAGSTYTLTNSYATANSQVFVTVVTSGAGVCQLTPVATTGTVTFTSINGTGAATTPTGSCKFNWWIVN
jgi:hypothetical protein